MSKTIRQNPYWLLVALTPWFALTLLASCAGPPSQTHASAGASGAVALASPLTPPDASSVAPVRLRRTGRPDTLEEKLAANLDPSRDGWDTEVLSDQVSSLLKELSHRLKSQKPLDRRWVTGRVADDFESESLRPSLLEEAFTTGNFKVRRWNATQASAPVHRGPDGFIQAMTDLMDGPGDIHVALKLFQIEKDDGFFTTRILLETSHRATERALQQNATWRAQWSYPATEEAPRLLALHLERYEVVDLEAASGALFADVTESAMGHLPAYREQVLPGINHWLPRVSLVAGMSIVGHHGLAVGDVNGDGLEDLYVCDTAGLPNRLYLQNDDGTLRDISREAGVDWLEASSSALLIDLDGDGDQDLAVSTKRGLLVSENDGSGHFTLRADLKNLVTSTASISAADFDHDGDLDLYICGYDGDPGNTGLPGPVPYHDAKNGGANVLLANLGNFKLENVTARVGLSENNHRFSFAATWDDFDNDGDVDLYVANDFGRNNLYQNSGGHFSDVAKAAAVEDVASGMSAAWGDFDRDGWMDVYVSNMFSSAGNRVAYQRSFTDSAAQVAGDLQRMARGNTLFKNNENGSFRDVSEDTGVTMGRWAWASKFADLNNDSWPDLVVTNGYVTGEVTDDL